MIIQSELMKYLVLLHSLLVLLFKLLLQIFLSTLHIRQHKLLILTGVLKITLVANLTKRLQVTAVANSDEVYVITGTRHYLSAGEMISIDGNPNTRLLVLLRMMNMMVHLM